MEAADFSIHFSNHIHLGITKRNLLWQNRIFASLLIERIC